MGAELSTYTPDQVGNKVAALGKPYKEYRKAVLANRIDGAAALELDDEDLKDTCGVKSKLHRKQILKWLAAAASAASAVQAANDFTGGGAAQQPVQNPTTAGAPNRAAVSTRLASEGAALLRKGDPRALIGERVRVYDPGGSSGRVGSVRGVKTALGGSTRHAIMFDGGGGETEEVLLQKATGAGKGARFHVLVPMPTLGSVPGGATAGESGSESRSGRGGQRLFSARQHIPVAATSLPTHPAARSAAEGVPGDTTDKEAKDKMFNNNLEPRLKKWMREAPVAASPELQADKTKTLGLEEPLPSSGLRPGAVAELTEMMPGIIERIQTTAKPYTSPTEVKRLLAVIEAGNELYFGMYNNILTKQVRNNVGYKDFCTALNRIEQDRSNFPQRTGDLAAIYSAAREAHPLFVEVLEKVEQQAAGDSISGVEMRAAPLKHVFRVLQKHATRIDGGKPTDFETACDIVRGSIICESMGDLLAVLKLLLQFKQDGQIKIVRVKNRFDNPTAAGWADAMINFICLSGSAAAAGHVCELQLTHATMLKARKDFGGHNAYAAFREAAELLEFIVGGVLVVDVQKKLGTLEAIAAEAATVVAEADRTGTAIAAAQKTVAQKLAEAQGVSEAVALAVKLLRETCKPVPDDWGAAKKASALLGADPVIARSAALDRIKAAQSDLASKEVHRKLREQTEDVQAAVAALEALVESAAERAEAAKLEVEVDSAEEFVAVKSEEAHVAAKMVDSALAALSRMYRNVNDRSSVRAAAVAAHGEGVRARADAMVRMTTTRAKLAAAQDQWKAPLARPKSQWTSVSCCTICSKQFHGPGVWWTGLVNWCFFWLSVPLWHAKRLDCSKEVLLEIGGATLLAALVLALAGATIGAFCAWVGGASDTAQYAGTGADIGASIAAVTGLLSLIYDEWDNRDNPKRDRFPLGRVVLLVLYPMAVMRLMATCGDIWGGGRGQKKLKLWHPEDLHESQRADLSCPWGLGGNGDKTNGDKTVPFNPRWRHHCRRCGQSICAACSSSQLPVRLQVRERTAQRARHDLAAHDTQHGLGEEAGGMQRACDTCFALDQGDESHPSRSSQVTQGVVDNSIKEPLLGLGLGQSDDAPGTTVLWLAGSDSDASEDD
jgi:hypothetical protein